MRYLKVLALILFFFVGMVFFVQNTEALSDAIQLRLNLFHWRWISIEFPYYLLILIFFVIGALFSLAFFLAEKIRLTKQLRVCNHTVQSLQQELNSLRNLPLDEERYPAEEPSTE